MTSRGAPSLSSLLRGLGKGQKKPMAIVLAGHNGSGKSTLWRDKLGPTLQMPLLNADHLTSSILPLQSPLPPWAQKLRNDDDRWARLSQEGVRAFKTLVMREGLPFAFETVFSHFVRHPDGRVESKADDIIEMQREGYFVVLVFVGLAHVNLSVTRVGQRVEQGGHNVPLHKLLQRFDRTRLAIGHAAPIADATLMFDNSLSGQLGFSLARVQHRHEVLFDVRSDGARVHPHIRRLAGGWLDAVFPAIPETVAPRVA